MLIKGFYVILVGILIKRSSTLQNVQSIDFDEPFNDNNVDSSLIDLKPNPGLNLSINILKRQNGDKSSTGNLGNFVFSPQSVTTCLAMVFMGSGGRTRSELGAALFDGDQSNLSTKENLKAFDQDSKAAFDFDSNTTKLDVLNAQFVHNNLRILKEYYLNLHKYFRAKMFSINIGKDDSPDEVRKNDQVVDLVNRNVENWTGGKVKNLLQPGSIDSSTRVLIVNTIYFKSTWFNVFKNVENEQPFKCEKNNPESTEPKLVAMMKQTSRDFWYNFDDEKNVEVLGIPYSSSSLQFFIFLPHGNTTLSEFESKLNAEKFQQLVVKSRKRLVEATIPKFKTSSSLSLKEHLMNLGFENLFENADLSGMAQNDNLYISDITHSAAIEVNEKGSEAAAATLVNVQSRSAIKEDPLIFLANKSFLYAILNKSKMNVLFLGRFNCPL